MPNPNVTIRHARSAIHLIISGALRDIELEFNAGYQMQSIVEIMEKLFDEIADEIPPGTIATRLDAMLSEMQAELSSVPAYRDILNRYDLLP